MYFIEVTQNVYAFGDSTIPADTFFPAWGGGSWATGDRAIYNDYVIEALQNFSGVRVPPEPWGEDTAYWKFLYVTNKMAMFDRSPEYKAVGQSPVTVTIDGQSEKIINAIALWNVYATDVEVICRIDSGATEVYRSTFELNDFSHIYDCYEWFFKAFPTYIRSANRIITGLPSYVDMDIELIFTKVNDATYGNYLELGVVLPGALVNIGETEQGSSSSYTSFDVKTVDPYSDGSVVEKREFKKNPSYDVLVDTKATEYIQTILQKQASEPTVFIGHLDHEYSGVYGFFRGFDLVWEDYSKSLMTVTVEELRS